MPVLASYPALVLHLHPGLCHALETEWPWLGYVSSADFRHYVAEALDLARQPGVTSWIVYGWGLSAARPVDLAWIGEMLLPAMVKAGMMRFARLEAEPTLNRRLLGTLYQDATPALRFETGTFARVQQARLWATTPPPQTKRV